MYLFLSLSSLFLIATLATIFGKQFLKIKSLQTEVKSWTYETLSKQLVDIQTGLKSILNDPQTPVVEKEKAKKIFGETYQVFVSGKEMEKKVEE